MARLHRVLGAVAPLSAREREAFSELVEPRQFRAGTFLLEAGARAEWCHFIDQGLVRELYISSDGKEHTRSFVAEDDVTGSLVDLLSAQPSITFIEALEDTSTLSWRYRSFDALAASCPGLHVLARRWAEGLYVRKTRREHEMLSLSASARYASWLAQHERLDARVQRRALASYLGITPEHLSRLRRRR